jgi:hypothetical protein
MRKLWIVALLMTSLSAAAQTLEDVIYKKDGSVLRGTLVEQDFENGRYKIQLQGGSLFSVNKADIEKITKEAPFVSSDAKSDGINININNNPSISQNPVIEQSPVMSLSQTPNTEKSKAKSVFYIGTMSKSFSDDNDDNGASYSGLNLAYQANASEHIALYTALNIGSLSTVTENSVEYDVAKFTDESYRSFELDALLSSNNYQGWQFYTGLGLFTEKYSTSSDSETFSGTNFILGMGYSWQTLQAQLRVAINNSSDYNDEFTHSSANLQLGFNFL